VWAAILRRSSSVIGVRASEILALRWSAILWGEGQDGETKTEASDGYVRMQLLPNTGVRDAFCSSEADPLFGFKLAANEIQ
jgi:integrase